MFKLKAVFNGFSSKDPAKIKEFYSKVLGLEVRDEEMGVHIVLPNGAEIFVYQSDKQQPATYTMLNLVVDDIDEAVDELVKRGVTFERYDDFPQDEKGIVRGIAADRGPDIAWFKDPEGNVLSVLQDAGQH